MKFLILTCTILFSQLSWSNCNEVESLHPFEDSADGQIFTVKAKGYVPNRSTKVPAVFILPPIVGETVLDRRMGQKLCQNGIAAYILNVVKVIPTEEEYPNLLVHDQSFVRALAGTRAVMKSLSANTALNGKFGIIGTSQGGMFAAYVAGSEPAIEASVIVVGAGNVPGVLASSDQEYIKAQREARLKIFNLTTEAEYEALLRPLIPNDPLAVAQQISPGSVYFFIAQNDTTVPTRFQRELLKKIPSPLVFEMKGDHFQGIVKAGTVHAEKIVRFFKRKLN